MRFADTQGREPAQTDGEAGVKGLSARLVLARHVVEFAVHKARELRLAEVAASLTFSSVLALVPLVAVVLAILTAFPIFSEFRESLERDLPKGLLPVPYAQTILRYLTDFAAKAAGVGVAGFVFLVLSALSMILTVDRVLNDIWQVHRRRPLAHRLLLYWAVLSVGPLMLGISLTLTSFVISASEVRVEHGGALVKHTIALLSPVIATAVYSAAYALVPNRRVSWRHALTGGVVTALTGELMSRGFAAYVLHGSLLSIYGAFAAVPIFLMWIFLSWLTFLFGAAIAATLPQLRRTRFTDARRVGDGAVTAFAVLKLLTDARLQGSLGVLSLGAMSRALRTDEEALARMLAQLEELGYVRRLAQGPAPAAAPQARPEAGGAAGEGARGAQRGARQALDAASGEWILSCDPYKTGLGPAFHRFAIDPRNSLLLRKDLGLDAWLAPVLHGPWLERGLALPAGEGGAAG
jgi:membrane protein